MRLFYNEAGEVVGSVDSPFEDKFGIPDNATAAVTAPAELALQLTEALDPLHPHDLIVVDNGAALQLPDDTIVQINQTPTQQ